MTLNLVDKTHGIMVLLSCGNGNFRWMLSVLGRRYLVACCSNYPDRIDLWVMKEYAVKNILSSPVSLWS